MKVANIALFKRFLFENGEPFFCGLHGCARVDPDGPQQDLDHQGGCGFIPASRPRQLELFK